MRGFICNYQTNIRTLWTILLFKCCIIINLSSIQYWNITVNRPCHLNFQDIVLSSSGWKYPLNDIILPEKINANIFFYISLWNFIQLHRQIQQNSERNTIMIYIPFTMSYQLDDIKCNILLIELICNYNHIVRIDIFIRNARYETGALSIRFHAMSANCTCERYHYPFGINFQLVDRMELA